MTSNLSATYANLSAYWTRYAAKANEASRFTAAKALENAAHFQRLAEQEA